MARIVKAPDERRSELIACAQTLFYTKGYERTSVSDIVKAVDVAKGTFYYYFDSKQAILEAMVDELVTQQVALLHDIIANETLPTLPKWVQAFEVTGNWKIEHKDEMIAVLRLMRREENIRLLHTIRATAMRRVAPEIAKIVAQGVNEGVFAVEFIEETAVIVLSVMEAFSNTIGDLVLNPTAYDDPAGIAQRKLTATQTAIERILQAPQGTLPITEPHIVSAWFE